MTTATKTLAYHFVSTTLRDGRPIPADGEWLTHEGRVAICASGLHASRHVADALKYAPGNTLCLVECEAVETEHDDKFVCRRRRIVARFDATELLREYARWCALQVIELWDAPPVVRQYLTTGDESLRAAAARAAADAAYAAAVARAAAADAAAVADAAAAADAADAAYAAAAVADAAAAYAYAAARADAAAAAAAAAAARAYAAARAAQRDRLAKMVDAKFAEMGVTP